MARLIASAAATLAAATMLAACAADSADRVLAIGATGEVIGVAYVDRDGDLALNPNVDVAAPGVRLSLVLRGTREAVAVATSDATGAYAFRAVPVGNYRVVVDTASVGDSLRVARVDTADITIAANDTTAVLVAVGYRPVDIADARALAIGKRVFVEGVALNTWPTFGDSTVHVADATGAIRLARLPALNFLVGDSVGVLGTLELLAGRPVLTDVTAFRIGQASVPEPRAVSTATAAAADGGSLDAALVRVAGEILTVQTAAGNDVDLTVDDGSGPVVVRIDRDTGIQTGSYVPGGLLDATGLLVSEGTGPWRIKPRGTADLVLDYREVTVAQARREPVGQLVRVEGIALNAWQTFGDATLHLADTSAAIRAVNVQQSTVQAGDSIRLVGRVAIQNGQPVLTDAAVFPISSTTQPPAPDTVLTAEAASARGGALDAALVSISDAVILDAGITTAGDRLLRVDDGSGAVEVVIDQNAPIAPGLFVPQAILDATGLLVPSQAGGAWRLKPRSDGDVSVRFDSVTIAQARTLQPGKLVAIIGVALNGRETFGDASVHLHDATGAIRATNVSGATPIFAGDSVRFIGTIRIRDGQPVLDAVTPEKRAENVGLPAPHDLSVGDAATAANGARDAALVRVRSVSITANNAAGFGRILLVSGSGGQLEVHLMATAVPTCTYCTAGNVVDITGVLVPVPGETRWVLRPRSLSDIVE